MKNYRILCFDGGGIKGTLSIRLLKRIIEKYPTFLDNIDLFAGTSTGSLIALALASNKSVDAIDRLYSYEITKSIFTPSHFNLFKPKYSNNNLSTAIIKILGADTTLSDLPHKVFIPSFNVSGLNTSDKWQIVFFHNLYSNETIKAKAVDVALASSAAPTFFPSHNGYIDGGVVANSPTTCAAIGALTNTETNISLSNIKLLSIGTGNSPDKIYSNTSKWGLFQWTFDPFVKGMSPLLSIFMDGMSDLDNFYCQGLLKNNYFRINPRVSKHAAMDNYKLVHYLRSVAEETNLNETFNFIENVFLK